MQNKHDEDFISKLLKLGICHSYILISKSVQEGLFLQYLTWPVKWLMLSKDGLGLINSPMPTVLPNWYRPYIDFHCKARQDYLFSTIKYRANSGTVFIKCTAKQMYV